MRPTPSSTEGEDEERYWPLRTLLWAGVGAMVGWFLRLWLSGGMRT